MGIVLAVLAVLGVDKVIDISEKFSLGRIGSLIFFILLLTSLAKVCLGKKKRS